MGMRAYGPAPASRLLIELARSAGITIHVGRHQINAEKFQVAFGFSNADAKKQLKNQFNSKSLKNGFAPLELIDAMVWEMLRILPKQHPSWVMHPSLTCAIPNLAIIEESLANGKATQELRDWSFREAWCSSFCDDQRSCSRPRVCHGGFLLKKSIPR